MFDQQPTDEFQIPAELIAIERRLRSLASSPSQIDRDRLMFEAGRAAASGHQRLTSRERILSARFWPVAAATMTAATILLSAMLLRSPTDRGSTANTASNVAASLPASPSALPETTDVAQLVPVAWRPASAVSSGYLGSRYVALTRGVDALEMESPAHTDATDEEAPTLGARELLQDLLSPSKHKNS